MPQYELPFAVHERLWAIKYILLLVLGISLESMATAAEKFAEVEPFKTAITLHFMRDWGFVLWLPYFYWLSIYSRAKCIVVMFARWAHPWPFRPNSVYSTGSNAVKNVALLASFAPLSAKSKPFTQTALSMPMSVTTTVWIAKLRITMTTSATFGG